MGRRLIFWEQKELEPSFIKGLKELRFPVFYRYSKEMAEHIADYYQFYGKILKEMGFAKQ